MARSKSGGTRSYIRGKIGADVYCVGKTGKGDRQQVVRSLAEQVANPQTSPQMVQRMLMSSVAQLTRALKPIIDHSFDGVPAGQPSISHFRQLALNAYKADSELSTPIFGYVDWQSKLIPNANVQISSGKAVFPVKWYPDAANQYAEGYKKGGFTAFHNFGVESGGSYAGPCSAQDIIDLVFGGSVDNYLTYVSIKQNIDSQSNLQGEPFFCYCRMQFNPNWKGMEYDYSGEGLYQNHGLIIDGNISMRIGISSGQYAEANQGGFMLYLRSGGVIADPDLVTTHAEGLILSKKDAKKGYIHTSSLMMKSGLMNENGTAGDSNPTAFNLDPAPNTMAEAIATYPLGSARFLNGGDI